MTAPSAENLIPLWKLPTRSAQLAWLDSAEISPRDLLQLANQFARSNPQNADTLAALVATQSPDLQPQAYYLQARLRTMRGELQGALTFIDQAEQAHIKRNETFAALRTNLGRSHILNELGQHAAALAATQTVIDALADQPRDENQTLVLTRAYQNRGVILETTGQYEGAQAAYESAEILAKQINALESLSDIKNNRGIVLTHLGRVTEAINSFKEAIALFANLNLDIVEAQAWSNCADAHLSAGQYTDALAALREAESRLVAKSATAHELILRRKTGDVYRALNLYPEAITICESLDEPLLAAGMSDHRARMLWGWGATLSAMERWDEAATLLTEAAQLFAHADNIPLLARVRLAQMTGQQAQGQSDAARITFSEMESLLDAQRWPVQWVAAQLQAASLQPSPLATLQAALAAAQQLGLPTLIYRAHQQLGHVYLHNHDPANAQRHLTAAIDIIESLRGTLAHEMALTAFLRDKTGAYDDLLQLYLASGAEEEAFTLAERAKSRTLVDLLTGVIVPAAASDELLKSAETIQLAALQADLNATYNQFFGSDEPLAQLQARAKRLEQQIAQIRLRTEGSRRVKHAERVAERFSKTPLVAFHILNDEILAFVAWQGERRVVRQVGSVIVVRRLLQRLAMQWDRFRAGTHFAERHLQLLERSARKILQDLYVNLVAPLAEHLPTDGALTIVPHGLLHQVPFHALHDGATYLLEKFEIGYAPSVTVWELCQQKPRVAGQNTLVIGSADDLIPLVAEEAAQIGALLDATVLLNEGATIQQVRERIDSAEVVHFACHGLFRADNPLFSALKLHDGWLTAADVMQCDFSNALVTLSACESGRSTVLHGDEVIGLPRAFLSAGAATVVVSLWLVPDETTGALMQQYYQQLPRTNRAAALRNAQLALMQTHPHPYFWGAFVSIGQR